MKIEFLSIVFTTFTILRRGWVRGKERLGNLPLVNCQTIQFQKTKKLSKTRTVHSRVELKPTAKTKKVERLKFLKKFLKIEKQGNLPQH